MDSSREVPLLDNSGSRIFMSRIFVCLCITCVAGLICFAVLFVMCMFDDGIADIHQIRPEVGLKSVIVCPTISDSLIWDLKFDLINNEKDSNFCLNSGFGFQVSVFLNNQSKIVTKAFATLVTPGDYCIVPGNRTSLIGLVEDGSSSIQDLINEYSDPPTSGTIRLDLKIHRHDYDYVCGDAKVDLSSSSRSSACGSMVGDPFACSYPPPPRCTSSCRLWLCASPIVVLLALIVLSVLSIGLIVFLAINCPCSC